MEFEEGEIGAKAEGFVGLNPDSDAFEEEFGFVRVADGATAFYPADGEDGNVEKFRELGLGELRSESGCADFGAEDLGGSGWGREGDVIVGQSLGAGLADVNIFAMDALDGAHAGFHF